MSPRETGRATIVLLCVIFAFGLGLRVARALDPIEEPGADALAYGAIASSLYADGTYGPPSMQNESDWSPGAPLLYAGLYYATGGVREGVPRLAEAVAGALAILVAFALGGRLGRAVRDPSDGAVSGLLAALGVAVYPAFIYDAGRIMSEPVAILLLPAAVLAFLVALDRRGAWWWALAGALIGLTAMFRPEYLGIGFGLAALAGVVVWRRAGSRPGLVAAGVYAAALIVVIAPWMVRNYIAYDRFVPLATGGGKALYIGANLPADGEHFATKRILYRRFHPHTKLSDEEIDVKPMQPLLDRVAGRYPDLPRDSALGKIGRQNLRGYLSEQPLDYVAMTGRKVWRMWTSGSGPSMTSTAAAILHNSLLVLGLFGLGLLAWRRRVEALVIGGVIAAITAIGAVLLASTRRNLILMPLVISLAAVTVAWIWALVRERVLGAGVAGNGAERPYPLADRVELLPPPLANLLPAELTAIRALGLVIAAGLVAFAVWRRRMLRNADVLILLVIALGLVIVSGTELLDSLLSAFSFERGNGTRIVGVAILAIFILFLLVLRALAQGSRITRELSGVLEGIAWEEFRNAGHPERFRDRIGVVIPAYNEEESLGMVLDQIPATVCNVETAVLVIDDGSRDGTDDVARRHGAVVARHVINRGGGAALRTGYRLMADSGAKVVVTLDADGQHLPSEMEKLVAPVLSGEVAVAHGSRVLGEAEQNQRARELGIVFFNRVVSFITRTRVSDCSNGYRAVRADVLPQLVLRQEQFHTSEFLIEAIKRGIPAKEVPVTVVSRLHGHSKKPAVVRYGLGFANAIVRTWLR